ncbi:hypothetical protein ACIBO2_11575 [Nonomuraea sp. NPDC050022]|uniref:hypothetical protein n=1 Tax=unclassified Nonomuraea TaxID=2593643 RepID=UPI0033E0DCB4
MFWFSWSSNGQGWQVRGLLRCAFPAEWTQRELRHSFISLLSDNGTQLEEISRLVVHNSTAVAEAVYCKQIRPVLQAGAGAMDRVFAVRRGAVVTLKAPSDHGRGLQSGRGDRI